MVPPYKERGEQLTPGAQQILAYLVDHPLDYRKEIRHALKMPNGSFQYHLQILQEFGLIRPVRYEGNTYYRILVRGAPRVMQVLQRLGWDDGVCEYPALQVALRVDEIHLAADRAIIARAARQAAKEAAGRAEQFVALRSLLVL